ncbi:protein EXORDIUM-like 7 [Cynara cardunculus var. scolymus]|uniref:Phosphate-induced protein 1 n=1 Tax=Cynara cardunculus var. scolymus TaxID=59895 RepID=A0A103Y5U5_CYNCS|nr:protein EXORDIUM-like 7 [Cynara cardunculus var. scolymus]KVI03070.1 Phosphate-induced protein 1 [Cynara cardunculus var. scolymus]
MLRSCHLLFICFSFLATITKAQIDQFKGSKNYEGPSNLVDLQYHMGPILTSPIDLYIIWYGNWNPNHQSTIRDFIYSLSSSSSVSPSVFDWWQTIRLYTDQTGSNITKSISLSQEFIDSRYSHGKFLTRLSIQSVIKNSIQTLHKPLPLNYRTGLYLVLTSSDVQVQDFCREVCGFHYFTFPSIVGGTLPYAWVGNSGTQCPGFCAYPFAWPKYSGMPTGNKNIMGAPNGDPGTEGMISVIAHELAEVSTDPFISGWYAGNDPSFPNEIADLCVGVYGTGAGGGFVGQVYKDKKGNAYNLNGVKGRRFLVQWVWDPVKKSCFGPNAIH